MMVAACVPEGPPTIDSAPESSAEDVGVEAISRFADRFERAAIGPDYLVTGDGFVLENGALCAEGAKNQGVWLNHRLPRLVRIEFDAVPRSGAGDIKVELFGDGKSSAAGESYTDASGYIAILGGWDNSLHVFARLDEHGKDRQLLRLEPAAEDPRKRPLAQEQPYHLVFERRSLDRITWTVNGALLMEYRDGAPLLGDAHAFFGFNNWVAPVCFDNLEIAAF